MSLMILSKKKKNNDKDIIDLDSNIKNNLEDKECTFKPSIGIFFF